MTFANNISGVLEKLGEAVTLTYETNEVRDGATGEIITAATEVEVDGFGYPGQYTNRDIDGDVIRRGDIRLTLNNVTTRPKVGWKALVDSVTYRVMDVRKVRRSGEDIVYILQLRV